MRTHQAFVRLSSMSDSSAVGEKGHEIVFVAEPDATHLYKFDMVIALRCEQGVRSYTRFPVKLRANYRSSFNIFSAGRIYGYEFQLSKRRL